MVTEYVKDPRMRRHMGIGRRLAPLLDNDRRLAELLQALLFSLPGSPVLYYGDEILMGDNVYLGDRDSVRTPMQWSPDRNGGFSRADFAQLYLPPLMDPVYGYEAVNVEAQQREPQLVPAVDPLAPPGAQAIPRLRHGLASRWCPAPTRRSSPTCAAPSRSAPEHPAPRARSGAAAARRARAAPSPGPARATRCCASTT